ncbi:MAG: adenosine [Planctomycetota bacterium]|nr:MAG: adenosine [Planctomycetota bacterium]
MTTENREGLIETAVRRMPKAEMHFHFEGAFRWSTVRELHPDGRALPEIPPWHGKPFENWEAFTAVFSQFLKPVTGKPEWIERHALEALEDLALQNVRYVELLVSHRFHAWRGLSEREVWEAVVRGRARAQAKHRIDAPLFLGVSRDQPPEAAEAIFEQIAEFAVPAGWLKGIDLQSDERARPNRDFARLYAKAAQLGLKLRAHAGEHGGAENVRDAVDLCGALHISHGTRAAEEPALVAYLARTGAWLHLCPSSNWLLGVCPSIAANPLRKLQDAGVRCTVNSDDPLLFATDTTREYLIATTEMGFSRSEIAGLAKNAFGASLLADRDIAEACAEIDRCLSTRKSP